ncbi:MAG: DNA repair protein RecO [Sporolactobacillus sp.]
MVKAEGIVLRTTDYGETNKIITVYTKEYGKIGLMARGAKRPKSTLASVSHVLFYGLCLFNKGRGLGLLYQAESIQSFTTIRMDIEKMGYAALIAELTDRLTEDGRPSTALYRLIVGILLLMEDGSDPAVLSSIFAIKMMEYAGIRPRLDRCIKCGGNSKPFFFSVAGGGMLCCNCARTDPYALSMSAATARLLVLFLKIPIERIGNISLKPQTIHEIEQIIYSCYEQNAGIKLRARRFIDQLARFQGNDHPTGEEKRKGRD